MLVGFYIGIYIYITRKGEWEKKVVKASKKVR